MVLFLAFVVTVSVLFFSSFLLVFCSVGEDDSVVVEVSEYRCGSAFGLSGHAPSVVGLEEVLFSSERQVSVFL